MMTFTIPSRCKSAHSLGLVVLIAIAVTSIHAQTPAYLNPAVPTAERIHDLIFQMTLDEKAQQLVHPAAGIPRLNVPEYNWWSEGLHGVAFAGTATVFPEPIGLAATFDTPLIHEMATVISTEARAKHHQAVREGKRAIMYGLTFWSPNVNIFRDPRWGRGQETYGEDPFLTARMGVAFVEGMQGDDPKYLARGRNPQALCRAQRPRAAAPLVRRPSLAPRYGRHLLARISRHRRRSPAPPPSCAPTTA